MSVVLWRDVDGGWVMVVKKFGVDFTSEGGALTLEPSCVVDGEFDSGVHSKTHESGWTITGEIREDYYRWVNDFTATHPEYGTISGDFEKEVTAKSEEAFQHFWKHHEPTAWNYWDI